MAGDIELTHAKREIDRIEIFEGPGQQRQVRCKENQQQRDGG
jgi:hypothetical protein